MAAQFGPQFVAAEEIGAERLLRIRGADLGRQLPKIH